MSVIKTWLWKTCPGEGEGGGGGRWWWVMETTPPKDPATTGAFYFFNNSQSTKNALQYLAPSSASATNPEPLCLSK